MPTIHHYKSNKYYSTIHIPIDEEVKKNEKNYSFITCQTEFFNKIRKEQYTNKKTYKNWITNGLNKSLPNNITRELFYTKDAFKNVEENTYKLLIHQKSNMIVNVEYAKRQNELSSKFKPFIHNELIDFIVLPIDNDEYEWHTYEEYGEHYEPKEFMKFHKSAMECDLDIPFRTMFIKPLGFYRFKTNRTLYTNIDTIYYDTKVKHTNYDFVVYQMCDKYFHYEFSYITNRLKEEEKKSVKLSKSLSRINKIKNEKSKKKKSKMKKQITIIEEEEEVKEVEEVKEIISSSSDDEEDNKRLQFDVCVVNKDKITKMIYKAYKKKSLFYELTKDCDLIYITRDIHNALRYEKYDHFNLVMNTKDKMSNTYHIYVNETSIVYYTMITKHFE